MKVVSKNIEMIAYFKTDGSIRPIRFRIEEEQCEVIKITKILRVEMEKLCGNKMMVYTCCALIDGIDKIFEIKYDLAKMKWILFKI